MSEHTPGPWRWEGFNRDPATRLMAAGSRVLEIYESHGGGSVPNTADSDLIKAAPDLLAALKLIVEHFGDPLKVARPAIAKAEGKGQS